MSKQALINYEKVQRGKLPFMHEFHAEGCDNGAGGRGFQAQVSLVIHDYDADFIADDGVYYGHVRECKAGGGKWYARLSKENVTEAELIKLLPKKWDWVCWTDEYRPEEPTAFCFRVTEDFIRFLLAEGVLTHTRTKRDGSLWRVHHGGETSPMWAAVEKWQWYTAEEMREEMRTHPRHKR